MAMLRAALYCRLSKDDMLQGDSESIKTQKAMLTQYAKEHGFLVVEIYVDDGYSGLNFDRPSFNRMLDDIEAGKIDVVITKDLSRLGRDHLKVGHFTEIYFPMKNVRYIAVNDGVDTANKNNDIAALKNVMNEFYSRDNSRKIRSSIRARAKAGLYRSSFEHDNCGIGAVVNIKGEKSHATVENALKIVENLEHRAGKDAEGKTGDGVGILLQISHKFFSKACSTLGFSLGGEREYGVGVFFFPQNELKRNQAKKMFEIIVEKEGLELLGWRTVPTVPEVLGHKARECMPYIMQAFIKKPEDVEKGIAFDRRLYVVRRVFEQSNDNTYVPSLSSRTIVYKGMFLVGQLRTFFRDLQDVDYESAIAMVHSRFSTNTNPSWERAHPNRFIVHNGEINTIRGNADKMLAREETMSSPMLQDELHKVLPVVNTQGSDSAMLDNTLEFLTMSGMDLPLAVMITIPEPWANNDTISQEKRDFYQYYATMMEPWDGPASILFSDGDVMGAVLDRNGLRPSRYYITNDGFLILSSEVGVLEVPEEKIVYLKDKLRTMDDDKFSLISTVQMKDPNTVLLVSIFLGVLGIDRFMIGDTGMGILKLLTCGCCGVLTIIDWFTISKKTRELNFNKVMTLL